MGQQERRDQWKSHVLGNLYQREKFFSRKSSSDLKWVKKKNKQIIIMSQQNYEKIEKFLIIIMLKSIHLIGAILEVGWLFLLLQTYASSKNKIKTVHCFNIQQACQLTIKHENLKKWGKDVCSSSKSQLGTCQTEQRERERDVIHNGEYRKSITKRLGWLCKWA